MMEWRVDHVIHIKHPAEIRYTCTEQYSGIAVAAVEIPARGHGKSK